jgi:hypothetical protein
MAEKSRELCGLKKESGANKKKASHSPKKQRSSDYTIL